MKFLFKIFAALLVFGISLGSVYAINAPVNVVNSNTTANSSLIQWDNIETALGYHVYFSQTPNIDILTADKKEYLSENQVVLDNLDANTQYYYVVSAFDGEGEDSEFSSELSFTTTNDGGINNEEVVEMNSAWEFKLSGIETLAQNQISVIFTSYLENNENAERIFKVVDKNDELIQYAIKESKIDVTSINKVIITFEELLPVNTEFKLTVISILDENGRNLESGIESFENFIIEEEKLNYVYQEEEGGIVIINDDNTTTIIEGGVDNQDSNNNQSNYAELNNTGSSDNNRENNINNSNGTQNSDNTSVSTEDVTNQENNSVEAQDTWSEWNNNSNELEWKNMSTEDVAIDLLSAGKEAESLPTTGPEHIFMLILALVFWAMSFVFKFKKS